MSILERKYVNVEHFIKKSAFYFCKKDTYVKKSFFYVISFILVGMLINYSICDYVKSLADSVIQIIYDKVLFFKFEK